MSQESAMENPKLPVSVVPARRWYARKWAVVLFALVLFVSGALVGGALVVAWTVRHAQYAAKHPEEAHRKMLERMVKRLNLTPEQSQRVEGVIARRLAALRALRMDVQPRVRAEIDTTSREIQAELTPAQAQRWQAMVDRIKANWMPDEQGKGLEE